MPDSIDPLDGGPYIRGLDTRVSALEGDVRDLRETQSDLKATTARIEAMLGAALPNLATNAGLAGVEARTNAGLARVEATTDAGLARVEAMTDAGLARVEAMTDAGLVRLDAVLPRLATEAGLARVEASLPHLATQAQVARLPTKSYFWAVVGVLVTAMLGTCGAVLAAISVIH